MQEGWCTNMTYKEFSRLYDQAVELLEYENEEYYVAREWEEWMDEYEDNVDIIIEILRKTYRYARGNISELRMDMQMSVPVFGRFFGIPRRTIQDWEYGKNNVSGYIKKMMVYIGLMEQIQEKIMDV